MRADEDCRIAVSRLGVAGNHLSLDTSKPHRVCVSTQAAMPWETPPHSIIYSVQGQVAKVLGVIIIVIGLNESPVRPIAARERTGRFPPNHLRKPCMNERQLLREPEGSTNGSNVGDYGLPGRQGRHKLGLRVRRISASDRSHHAKRP